MNEEKNVPITLGEKYMLTIREASIYFNIGVKKSADWRKIISEYSLFTVATDI